MVLGQGTEGELLALEASLFFPAASGKKPRSYRSFPPVGATTREHFKPEATRHRRMRCTYCAIQCSSLFSEGLRQFRFKARRGNQLIPLIRPHFASGLRCSPIIPGRGIGTWGGERRFCFLGLTLPKLLWVYHQSYGDFARAHAIPIARVRSPVVWASQGVTHDQDRPLYFVRSLQEPHHTGMAPKLP
jgi:hypothetical protein